MYYVFHLDNYRYAIHLKRPFEGDGSDFPASSSPDMDLPESFVHGFTHSGSNGNTPTGSGCSTPILSSSRGQTPNLLRSSSSGLLVESRSGLQQLSSSPNRYVPTCHNYREGSVNSILPIVGFNI
jgi:hypothetical protein